MAPCRNRARGCTGCTREGTTPWRPRGAGPRASRWPARSRRAGRPRSAPSRSAGSGRPVDERHVTFSLTCRAVPGRGPFVGALAYSRQNAANVPGRHSRPGARVILNDVIDRLSVLLVALAAMLWGTDALFRAPLLNHLGVDPIRQATQLVTMEHVILTIVCLPILWKAWGEIRSLTRTQWIAIVAIGVGASGLATILFTISFRYGHFIETLLLQKTQPLIAILLAHFWLGERISQRAWLGVPVSSL